jgi:DNA-binding MarR family transcriptional regulator
MSEINYKYVNIKLGNHKPPVFKIVNNQDWIEFGVEVPYKNNYPKYIQSLYERSNMHSAFLKAKHYYICGNGITVDKTAKTIGDVSALLNELKETNQQGESISEILNKCVLDYVLFGGCYAEVIWSRNGKKFELNHMPFNNLRRSVNNDGYWYSNDWSQSKANQTKEKTDLEFIPDYDKENPTGKQIYALKAYGIGSEYYPKPEYLGLVPVAEVEYEIANYHLNAIKSGFHIGTIITFVGKPTPTEQDEIERQLKMKFQGTDAAGSLLLQFTRDKDGAPQITRLTADDLDKKFDTLTKWVDQQLTAGHHMSPILAGIKTEGQLGGRTEIDLAHDLFKNTWVKPNQRVLENWINKLYEFYGFEDRIKFKEVRPIAPFEFKDVLAFMTKDEIREMAGLVKVKEDKGQESLADTLGIISPLVATKVLEKMTNDEIRSIIGLNAMTDAQKQELNPTVTSNQAEFSKQNLDDLLLAEFGTHGKNINDFEVIEKRDLTPSEIQRFASNLRENILKLLSKDPLITDEALAEALKVDVADITAEIDSLIEEEIIKDTEKNQEGVKVRKINVTAEGKTIAEDSTVAEVRYEYDWRSEIPSGERDTNEHPSRAFCKKLMELKKVFSRAEIDAISARVGLNVWEYRGGWWNDNGFNSPSCRHIWKAVILKRKK